jgi:hypothetical protein
MIAWDGKTASFAVFPRFHGKYGKVARTNRIFEGKSYYWPQVGMAFNQADPHSLMPGLARVVTEQEDLILRKKPVFARSNGTGRRYGTNTFHKIPKCGR